MAFLTAANATTADVPTIEGMMAAMQELKRKFPQPRPAIDSNGFLTLICHDKGMSDAVTDFLRSKARPFDPDDPMMSLIGWPVRTAIDPERVGPGEIGVSLLREAAESARDSAGKEK